MTDLGTKRVALVIGSGSVKCAAALGLAKVLQREGIACSMLVGCSAGAMFAAALAAGHDIDKAAEMTRRLWTQDITRQPNRRAMLSVLLPRLFGFDAQFGLRHDHLIMQRLREGFGRVAIEDMLIPLFITATDFATGDQVVMDRGSVVEAVRASIAMPFIFQPWRMDGRLLVDGFLSDPLPVGVAMREGADVIIAMGFESPPQSRISSVAPLRLPVQHDHEQQPAQVALRLSQPRPPFGNHPGDTRVRASASGCSTPPRFPTSWSRASARWRPSCPTCASCCAQRPALLELRRRRASPLELQYAEVVLERTRSVQCAGVVDQPVQFRFALRNGTRERPQELREVEHRSVRRADLEGAVAQHQQAAR